MTTVKDCLSYPGYSVSDCGEAYTHRKRFGKGRGHGGYWYVAVSTDRGQRSIPLHVLLTDAFIGPCPEGKQVRHLDGIPGNNHLENLCYGTVKENAEDRIECGNHTIGERHGRALLTEEDVHFIRRLYHDGQWTIAAIARRHSRGESTIRDIVKGKHWKHVL